MGKIKDILKFCERKLLKGHDPDFMIIGTQKSGTTSLFYLLNAHPRLAGSWPKEMHYFSKKHQPRDLEWYKSHFTSLKKNPLFFEASPNYIYHEHVARKLKELYPSIKLIVVLRNPVDRAYSAWNMYYEHFKNGKLRDRLPRVSATEENLMYAQLTGTQDRYPSFKECAEIEMAQIEKGGTEGINFLRKGLYFDQIRTYLKYFERSQLLVIGIKDLKEPQIITDKVLKFLDVHYSGTWRATNPKLKNQRTYKERLIDADREFLNAFYEKPNQQLNELLGYKVNW